MELTKQELVDLTGIKGNSTLNSYLCRQEFLHIKKTVRNQLIIYKNVTEFDIEVLRMLKNRRKLTEEEAIELYEKLEKLGDEQWQKTISRNCLRLM